MTGSRLASLGIFALALIWSTSATAQTIRLRKEYHPEGSIVLLGDVAEITAGDRRTVAQLSRLELIVTPAKRPRKLRVGEIRELMTLTSLKPEKYVFRGAAAVTVFPRKFRPSRTFVTKKIRTQDLDSANRRLSKEIVKHLQQKSGQKNDWQVKFMMGKRNAEKILQASRPPRVSGGRSPWTGKQRFWVEVGTGDSIVQFPVYAQVAPKEFIVTTTRAIRRGQRISTADVELRPAPPQLRGAQVVYHLEDVVGRESKRSFATGQPVDARNLVKTMLVKRRQLVTVFARGPGIVVRMTARSLENGTESDLINIQSLDGKRRFSARVVGPQEVEIYVSPTVVSPLRNRQQTEKGVRRVSRETNR